MGWVEIRHPDGQIENYGEPPKAGGAAWDYPCSDIELFVPRNTHKPTPKALKTIFWYQVHFWGEGAYRRPVIKIQTGFNQLKKD